MTAEEPYTVILARSFEELVPGFIENRRKELEERAAASDHEGLSALIAGYADYLARLKVVYE